MSRALVTPTRPASRRFERRTLAVLAFATLVGSLGLAAGGTAGALLGAELAGAEAAGLPLGALVVGQALVALLVAHRTPSAGRGWSLTLGYAVGAAGAGFVVLAALAQSFTALMVGSAVLGGGNAAAFLTRYAAADIGDEATRGRGLGVVLFAAAVGAVASPNLLGLSGAVAGRFGLPPLTGLYLVAVVCSAVAAALLVLTSTPSVPYLGRGSTWLGPRLGQPVNVRDVVSGVSSPEARAALVVLGVTNLVMVAVMAIAPVHLVAHGHSLNLVGLIVSVHVAGMLAPSPLSGWAADRFGAGRVVAVGIALLVSAGVAGAFADGGAAFAMTLVLAVLGVGWNLGMVGGSVLLAASVSARLRPQVEGVGEAAMGVAAGLGAPVAGLLILLGGFKALSLAGAATAALGLAALRRRVAAARGPGG